MSGTRQTPRHEFQVPAPAPPTLPIVPVPSNFIVARRDYFAGVLPAYPTFTLGSVILMPLGTKKVTWWVHYTPGADGGFPRFHILVGNGTDYGSSIVLDASNFTTANAPFGTTPFYLDEEDGPPQTVAGAERIYSITLLNLPAACTQVGLAISEAGVPGTPGTVSVFVTGEG